MEAYSSLSDKFPEVIMEEIDIKTIHCVKSTL